MQMILIDRYLIKCNNPGHAKLVELRHICNSNLILVVWWVCCRNQYYDQLSPIIRSCSVCWTLNKKADCLREINTDASNLLFVEIAQYLDPVKKEGNYLITNECRLQSNAIKFSAFINDWPRNGADFDLLK